MRKLLPAFAACALAALLCSCGEKQDKTSEKEIPAAADTVAQEQETAEPESGEVAVKPAAASPRPAQITLDSQIKKESYSVGFDIGRDFKSKAMELDAEAFARGISDAVAGAEPLMSENQIRQAVEAFKRQMVAKEMRVRQEQAMENEEKGDAFLAENKKREGVVTLESGLQYEVIREGKGTSPKATDTVETHYRGTLLDGTVFDSSYERRQPVTFPVRGVIPGWQEALKLMKVGAKWKLYVPSELAYGQRGAGRKIGPNSTLVFEIELLGIK